MNSTASPAPEALVLKSGDQWLTTDSLRIEGIFTDEEHLDVVLRKLKDKNVISEYGYNCLSGYYGSNGRQCEYKHGCLTIELEPINQKTCSLLD